MGLHICYDLSLPGSTTDDSALALLERLRAYALTLDVEVVTELLEISGRELSPKAVRPEGLTLQRLLYVIANGAREERDGVADEIADGDRLAAAAFLFHPGDRSESAMFGVVRPLLTERPVGAERPDEWRQWVWHYCCKTQYASVISDEHLVRCHLSVVHMLEEAQRIGFTVTVRDETFYWDTRSTDRLLVEVHNMNRVVARFAGTMHDALSPGGKVDGAIFAHPDFERLESEPIERETRDGPDVFRR